MTAAASSTRSGSIFAATSDEPYPSARVSKIAESWRSTPSLLHPRHAWPRTLRFFAAQSRRRARPYGRGFERKVPLDCVQQLRGRRPSSWSTCKLAGLRLLEERFLAHAHVLHRAEADRTRQITAHFRGSAGAGGPRSRLHPVGRRARGPTRRFPRSRYTVTSSFSPGLASPDLAHQLRDARWGGSRSLKPALPTSTITSSLHEPGVGRPGRRGRRPCTRAPAAGAILCRRWPRRRASRAPRSPRAVSCEADVACLVDRERQPRGGGVRRQRPGSR